MAAVAVHPLTDGPLSLHLRAATRAAHDRAERSGFVEALMGGRLTVAAYAELAAQHHVIYGALEAAEPFVGADPAGATMIVPGLQRVPSIERDLAALVGPRWREEIPVLPSTERYAARLRDVAGTWVGGYVAHAYTRYLGDLSGGLAIKAILQRSYGVPDEAVSFYTFPTIPKPKLFKDEYRARLDALPFDAAERERVAAEAAVAFELNTALFAELGERHPPRA
ncbi:MULTISPECIES: heme oxygenase (biliverdin-producing) [unclassified Actinotalea]|uniref:biliverdin-producing heme oxygenase n=1 Tax=unclassified Actinotalea TaxID=2638618 RepID=UPI0015F757EA|nr:MULTISPECIES: biliverdin-producing heme oxygenase [unclassified Actinotalea]